MAEAHLVICHFGGSLEALGSGRSKLGLVLGHPAAQGFPGIVHLLGMGSSDSQHSCMAAVLHSSNPHMAWPAAQHAS